LEASSLVPRLPLRDILNANPAWFRGEITDLDDLAASIKKVGLKVPVLLTRDLVMIDGARRVMAYKKLGLDNIPVILTDNWDEVVDYYMSLRKHEAAGLPYQRMKWEELDQLWRIGLVPLYLPKRYESQRRTLTAKKRGEPRPAPTMGVNHDLGPMFGMAEGAVKAIRDLFASLRRVRDARSKQAVQEAERLINLVEGRNEHGGTEGIYSLRNDLRDLASGKLSAIELKHRVEGRIHGRQAPINRIQRQYNRELRVPKSESQEVIDFCGVVTHFGDEAERLRTFDVNLNVEPLVKQLRTTVNRLNALRRRLENGAKPEGEQEV
jgi:hypothetical protein